MIRHTNIFIFLIFGIFLFHTAEQSFLLFEQTNQYTLQNQSTNQGDLEHQLSNDVHSSGEDQITSPALFSLKEISKIIALPMVSSSIFLTPSLLKHWEPPK